MKVRRMFAWYDLWVGFYWDRKTRALYFLPLPTVGWRFGFAKEREPGVACPVYQPISRTRQDWVDELRVAFGEHEGAVCEVIDRIESEARHGEKGKKDGAAYI